MMRRTNVAAPSVQVDDDYEPPDYPKNDSDRAGIKEALPYFFGTCNAASASDSFRCSHINLRIVITLLAFIFA
jgi:hypothetical protein